VSELIDQQDAGTARKGGVEIELLPHDAPIFDGQGWQQIEAVEQPLGIDAAVWLNITNDHVAGGVCGKQGVRRFEHRVRFADAGGRAKENAQPPALGAGLFGLYVSEKLVRVRPVHALPCSCAARRFSWAAPNFPAGFAVAGEPAMISRREARRGELPWLLIQGSQCVQRQIQLQDIDAGLAYEAQQPTARVGINQ
jgi:hypothetical protein